MCDTVTDVQGGVADTELVEVQDPHPPAVPNYLCVVEVSVNHRLRIAAHAPGDLV